MGNKIYRYIIIVEILVILVIFTPTFLGQLDITMPEAAERCHSDLLHHIATVTMPFGLLYELDSFTNMPLQYTNGSMVDVFVTPAVILLWCSMWCGIIYWLANIIRKKKTATVTVYKGEYWKKVFLANLAISLVSLVFIFLLGRHNDSGENFLLFMVVSVLTIICSFLSATAWWLAEKLWHNNRIFSLIIATSTGIAALVVIFMAVQIVKRTDFADSGPQGEQYMAASAAVADAAAEAAEPMDIVTADTTAAGAATDDDPPTPPLSSEFLIDAADWLLHHQLEIDSSEAKHQQTSDLAKMWSDYVLPLYEPTTGDRHSTYAYSKDHGLDEAIEQMAYVGRSGSRLRESFDEYKELLRKNISYKIYQTSIARYYVNKLLLTYTVLQAEGTPATRLEKLYQKMNVSENDYRETESFFSDVMPLVDNMSHIDPALNNSEDINAQRTAVWLVSFWARRYHEGNASQVHDILEEIQQMYDGK